MSDEVKTKKKRVNSKAKGSGFENQISKTLGEALSPMKFRRSQSSGAILGGINAKMLEAYSPEARSLFVGDVVPTNESDVFREEGWKLRFSLECKFYRDCDNLEQMFGNTKILGWFAQAIEDAAKIEKDPLLIFKFNRCDIYCGIDPTKTSLPKNISRTITIEYNRQSTGSFSMTRDVLTIFPLKEALADPSWFKLTEAEILEKSARLSSMQILQKQMQQNNPNPPTL